MSLPFFTDKKVFDCEPVFTHLIDIKFYNSSNELNSVLSNQCVSIELIENKKEIEQINLLFNVNVNIDNVSYPLKEDIFDIHYIDFDIHNKKGEILDKKNIVVEDLYDIKICTKYGYNTDILFYDVKMTIKK
jgi:hypothetical protein